MPMETSVAGIRRIEDREGRKLVAYRDSQGHWTIGVGMTTFDGYPVRQGMTITAAECDKEFAHQLESYEATVNTAVKVMLTQNQFDALVSLCWNIGKGGFAGSTVVRDLNAGRYIAAGEAFMMWNKPPEIIDRRKGEMAQFLTPDAAPAITPPLAGPPLLAPPKSLWARFLAWAGFATA